MRHFLGFLAGLVLAPAIVLITGWALGRLADHNEAGATVLSTSGASTIAALCGLALLMSLVLVPPRLTPLLSGIAGLALIGLSVLAHLRPDLVDRISPLPGAGGAVTLLDLGVYVPVGLALIIPLFVPTRWSGRRADDAGPAEEYFDGLYDEDYDNHHGASSGGAHRA